MLKASKSMTYATRRLKAGDLFAPRNRSDARVLVALGRAERVVDDEAVGHIDRPRSKARAHSPTPPPTAGHEEVANLRKQYEAKFGKKPFNGWDAATLRGKLAA